MEWQMQQGIVKWFDVKKGFGFINSLGDDFFIHIKDVIGKDSTMLKEGARVHFEPSSSSKGPVAKNLSVES